MNVIIFYDSRNTWLGSAKRFKGDGREFAAMAQRCENWYNKRGCSVVKFDVSVNGEQVYKKPMQKRHHMYSILGGINNKRMAFDRVIFFMHGHPYALNRGMVSMKTGNHVSFGSKIYSITNDDAAILFYSCKTAKDADDGFAATVSRLTERVVIGHLTSGHTVSNPYKRVFVQGLYPNDLWPKDDKPAWRKYKKMLKVPENAFNFVEGYLEG